MTNMIRLIIPKLGKVTGYFIQSNTYSSNATKAFKFYILKIKKIKLRHVAIGTAAVTVALGAAASIEVAGIAIGGAHNAAFSNIDDGCYKYSSENTNGNLPTEYNVPAIQ